MNVNPSAVRPSGSSSAADSFRQALAHANVLDAALDTVRWGTATGPGGYPLAEEAGATQAFLGDGLKAAAGVLPSELAYRLGIDVSLMSRLAGTLDAVVAAGSAGAKGVPTFAMGTAPITKYWGPSVHRAADDAREAIKLLTVATSPA